MQVRQLFGRAKNHWWFVLLVTLAFVAEFFPAGNPHLKCKPTEPHTESVQFEVQYFNFLSGLTIPTMGGLLAIIFLSHDHGEWRNTALHALYAFGIAMICIVCGYAMRNGWMISGKELSEPLLAMDEWIFGPVTAASYIVGLILLGRLAYLGPPASKKAAINAARRVRRLAGQRAFMFSQVGESRAGQSRQ